MVADPPPAADDQGLRRGSPSSIVIVVVVEQEVEWRSVDTGQVTDRQTVGSVFIVRDDQIARVAATPTWRTPGA